MRRFVLLFVLAALMLPPSGLAQEATPSLITWLLYVDEADNLMVYDSGAGTPQPLLEKAAGEQITYQLRLNPVNNRYAAAHIQRYPANEAGQPDYLNPRYDVWVIDLATGERVFEGSLLPEGFGGIAENSMGLGDPATEMTEALRQPPVWSPDGSKLAWVAGTPDLGATVAVLDLPTLTVTPLTDDPGYPYRLTWSPDGTRLVYSGIATIGSGAGYTAEGFFIAAADGSGSQALDTAMTGVEGVPDMIPVGFPDADTLLAHRYSALAGAGGLFLYNLNDGSRTELLPPDAELSDPLIYDPYHGAVVLPLSEFTAGTMGVEPGIYSLQPQPNPAFDLLFPLPEGSYGDVRQVSEEAVLIDGLTLLHLPTRTITTSTHPERTGCGFYGAAFSPSGAYCLSSFGEAEHASLIFTPDDTVDVLVEAPYQGAQWVFEEDWYILQAGNILWLGSVLEGSLEVIVSGVKGPFVGVVPG